MGLRAGCIAPRARAPKRRPSKVPTARVIMLLRRAARRRASRRPRAVGSRGRGAGTASRLPCRPAWPSRRPSTPACCSARSPCPWTCGSRDAERAHVCDGASVVVSETLTRRWRRRTRPDLALQEQHDLDAVAAVIHTSGTTSAPRPIELSYGNFLWSALGSAVALGPRSPRALAVRAAALPRRRPLDPRALRDLRHAPPSSTSASTPTACCTRCASRTSRSYRSSPPPSTRLLDAGLERPPALRHALTGGGPVPDGADRARPRTQACPSAPPTA